MSISILCLASAIYWEARGEPLAEQLMVANVVMNRVESNRFPNTVCEVVYQPYQFSFTLRQDLVPKDKKAWYSAMYWAESYLSNPLDYTSACHYHTYDVNVTWDDDMKAIYAGNHVFYEGGC